MRRVRSVSLGASILVLLNVVMALASIWVFTRMAPAIDKIVEQNGRSLQACEQMLAVIASPPKQSKSFAQQFAPALALARDNISDQDENRAIRKIEQQFLHYQQNRNGSQAKLVQAITDLGDINRNAMRLADTRAGQLGSAGAWGVVFMSSVIFFVGLLVIQAIRSNLLQPFTEISEVLEANRAGDQMRRCTGHDLPRDIDTLYKNINEVLDRSIR